MDPVFDIPDPSDWLETPLKDFSSLENALHCDICKEFYDTPMITSCCHTFCSKCIRTCLSANGKCPSCQTPDQASKLRNNWILQTVVDQFLVARPAALEVARREKEAADKAKRPEKRKRVVLDSDDIAENEQGRTTRSKSRRIAASQESEPEVVEVEDSEGDEDFAPEPEPDDGLVECLFGCGKRIKPEEMSNHLDRCEEEKQQASRAKSRTPLQSLGSRPPSAQDRKAPERIPELNSSLLNDVKLRQKLKDAGIPNWGPRQLMIKRHTEWVNLWNANCDSGGKKTQRELLRDLDEWERTQGGRAPNVNGLSSTIMRKDFDGAGWASSNKQDFSKLIADARRKKANPVPESEVNKDVDMVNGEHPREEALESEEQPALPIDQPPELQLFPPQDNDKPAPFDAEILSAIRSKVEAINEGRHIEPAMNANFEGLPDMGPPRASPSDAERLTRHPSSSHSNHDTGLEKARSNSRDEHLVNTTTGSPCDLPVHLHSSPVKKVPMFEMPRQPVSDVDGGEGR